MENEKSNYCEIVAFIFVYLSSCFLFSYISILYRKNEKILYSYSDI